MKPLSFVANRIKAVLRVLETDSQTSLSEKTVRNLYRGDRRVFSKCMLQVKIKCRSKLNSGQNCLLTLLIH